MSEATNEQPIGAQYGSLVDERDRLEARLAAVKAEMDRLQEPVLEWFATLGVDSVRLETGRTLSLRREVYPGLADGATASDALAALREAGLDEFAQPKVNWQSLGAFVRERDREGMALPQPFAGRIIARETFRVGSRRPSINGTTSRASEPDNGD